jgi:NADPH2:quinone reductase
MRAVICRAFGPPESLEVTEMPSLVPGPGQVVVAVEAAGVNFPDALMVQGKHQNKPRLPYIPGGELAGVVARVGPGVDHVQLGQRVYGTRIYGAYADEAIADAAHLRVIPDGISFEQAAVLSIAYQTSYYSLVSLAGLKAGETVLVLGAAGGVGLAAVEIARALGARVIAAASSPEKLAVCVAHGADETIDYEAGDLRARIRELSSGRGVDVVYDPVGGKYAEPALRGLAWRGRYLVVGFAAGEIPCVPLNLVLLKGASVIGVFLGEAWARDPEIARQVDAGVADLVSSGRIRPLVSARYPLDAASLALRAMLERRVTGKIVVVPK